MGFVCNAYFIYKMSISKQAFNMVSNSASLFSKFHYSSFSSSSVTALFIRNIK
jgi:hypothetical protein